MKNTVIYSLLFISISLSSCDVFKTKITDKDIHFFESINIVENNKVDSIHIMTWNIKFGGARINFFFDCIEERVNMTFSEVNSNMLGVKKFISQTDPDILFVQEIDIDSKRTAFINQVEWLLENSKMNYALYVPHWKAKYIPSNSLGRMNSGIAIFSKFPLSNAEIINLPLIKEQNPIVRYFYLKRVLLQCDVKIGDRKIKLLNTHLEAYSTDGTKKKQLDIVYERLMQLDKSGDSFIFAGDMNCLPPHTIKTNNFPDTFCEDEFVADDYSQESDWITPFYENFNPAISLENYKKDNSLHFTHSVDERSFWNRKLDYIFSNEEFLDNSGITWQSEINGGIKTMHLSDHCAISVIL